MYEAFIAGKIIQGRPIECWNLGNGPAVTLIIATIHGDEPAGTPLVKQLADHIVDHPSLLDGRTLVVVPVANPDEVTVHEMKRALEDERLGIRVIDVREPDEYQIAHIDGVPLFPLSTLPQRFTELDPNKQYYIHCKSGVRSLKALRFLKEQGFKYLKSVKGGISARADEIDPNMPKY